MAVGGIEKRAVTYRLPAELIDRLEQEAEKLGRPTTYVLMSILEYHLARICPTCEQTWNGDSRPRPDCLGAQTRLLTGVNTQQTAETREYFALCIAAMCPNFDMSCGPRRGNKARPPREGVARFFLGRF